MTAHYADESVTVHHGDCLDVLREMPDASVDSIVTDPPYGLGFMGKTWDDLPPGLPWAQECLRVLKPGGHLLAFGGTRTWHRLAVAIEDAGFEVRDSIAWLYGSGFPKSLDVSKAIDKAAGAARVDLGPGQWAHVKAGGTWSGNVYGDEPSHGDGPRATAPATLAAQQWQGWGTALKPAFEPIVVARKPLVGTVAANILAHGTGALNVDGCRVPGEVPSVPQPDFRHVNGVTTHLDAHKRNGEMSAAPGGRWPTNVLLDGSQADALDEQSGTTTSRIGKPRGAANGDGWGMTATGSEYDDAGGASRFFPRFTWTGEDLAWQERVDSLPTFRYEAKAPTAERPRVRVEGGTGRVAGTPARTGRECNVCGNRTVPQGGSPWPACGHEDWSPFTTEDKSADYVAHPTVKPLDLMRWLVRLVTPPGSTVLEPFAGSGTTAEACVIEGFRCIAIEREAAYLPLIVARLSKPIQPDLFGGAA